MVGFYGAYHTIAVNRTTVVESTIAAKIDALITSAAPPIAC
jgi:hypothetical protein